MHFVSVCFLTSAFNQMELDKRWASAINKRDAYLFLIQQAPPMHKRNMHYMYSMRSISYFFSLSSIYLHRRVTAVQSFCGNVAIPLFFFPSFNCLCPKLEIANRLLAVDFLQTLTLPVKRGKGNVIAPSYL